MEPKTAVETGREDALQLFLRMANSQFAQDGGHLALRLHAEPIDADTGLVAALVEPSGSVGREFQDGGTAQSPMGDEQRSGGFHLGTCYAGRYLADYSTHELGEGMLFQTEAEE